MPACTYIHTHFDVYSNILFPLFLFFKNIHYYTYIGAHTFARTCTHTNTHTHTHTHTHAYIHKNTCSNPVQAHIHTSHTHTHATHMDIMMNFIMNSKETAVLYD